MNKRKIVKKLLEAADLSLKIYDELSARKNFTINQVYNGVKIEFSICPEDCEEGDTFGDVRLAGEPVVKIREVILEVIGAKSSMEYSDKYDDLIYQGSEMDMEKRLDALFALEKEESV